MKLLTVLILYFLEYADKVSGFYLTLQGMKAFVNGFSTQHFPTPRYLGMLFRVR